MPTLQIISFQLDFNLSNNSKSCSSLYSKCSNSLAVISKIYNWINECILFYSQIEKAENLYELWWEMYSVWIVNFVPNRKLVFRSSFFIF